MEFQSRCQECVSSTGGIMKAYHFLKEDMKSGEGEESPWVVGETRTIKGKAMLCARGYHSSSTILDALHYAPGPVACLVEVSKPVGKDDSKQVSKTRTLIAALDATKVLHEFACRVAEDVLQFFEEQYPDDKRPRAAIETKRRWLKGKVTDMELAAANAAARSAASAADWDAAAAARAAGAAAWAAISVASAAALKKYNTWLEEMLKDAGMPA